MGLFCRHMAGGNGLAMLTRCERSRMRVPEGKRLDG